MDEPTSDERLRAAHDTLQARLDGDADRTPVELVLGARGDMPQREWIRMCHDIHLHGAAVGVRILPPPGVQVRTGEDHV